MLQLENNYRYSHKNDYKTQQWAGLGSGTCLQKMVNRYSYVSSFFVEHPLCLNPIPGSWFQCSYSPCWGSINSPLLTPSQGVEEESWLQSWDQKGWEAFVDMVLKGPRDSQAQRLHILCDHPFWTRLTCLQSTEVHFLGVVNKKKSGTSNSLSLPHSLSVSKWLVSFSFPETISNFSHSLHTSHPIVLSLIVRSCPLLLLHKGNKSHQERTSEFCHSSLTHLHLYPLPPYPSCHNGIGIQD